MKQDEFKKIVSLAALKYIKPNMIIGIGSGSTITYFINELKTKKKLIKGVVSSSILSTKKLTLLNIPILDSNNINNIDIYIDSVDEFNLNFMMIKGGGGALTREKVISSMAKQFIIIADESKQVNILGKFPLPIEIIPMAYNYVSNQIIKLGGIPKYRKNFITDNGNIIIDIHNLKIKNPIKLENQINAIPGVVTVGLFANHRADIILVATKTGINKFYKPK